MKKLANSTASAPLRRQRLSILSWLPIRVRGQNHRRLATVLGILPAAEKVCDLGDRWIFGRAMADIVRVLPSCGARLADPRGTAGDSLLFDATVPHGPEKLSKTPVRYLAVVSYPRNLER